MKEIDQDMGEAVNFKAEEPAGEYVEGVGLKLNFRPEARPALKNTEKKETPYYKIKVPEGVTLSKDQKESMHRIEFNLIGFSSDADMMQKNIDSWPAMALINYSSYKSKLETITSNIGNLPLEVGIQVIDIVGPAMAKADETIPKFEKAVKAKALDLAKKYEKLKDKPDLAASFAHSIVRLKEACASNEVDISAWADDPEINKILTEMPIEKQLSVFIRDRIQRFDKIEGTDVADRNGRLRRWEKNGAAGAAIRNYKEMQQRGLLIPPDLESEIQPLIDYNENYWKKEKTYKKELEDAEVA